jgi:hypothetical protein
MKISSRRFMITLSGIVMFATMPITARAGGTDTIQKVSWTLKRATDLMSNVTSVSLDGNVAFPDGNNAQLALTCDAPMLALTLTAFHNNDGESFNWGNENAIALRAKLDDGDIGTLNVKQEQYDNQISIYFVDPNAAQVIIPAAAGQAASQVAPSDPGNQVLGALGSLYGYFGTKALIASAAGQIADLETAKSLLLELPLVDGSDNVLQLAPNDPTFRKFATDCAIQIKNAAQQAAQKAQASEDVSNFQQAKEDASRGNAGAEYRLGTYYEEGKGTVKDFAQALSWYRKSYDSDYNVPAMQKLADIYYNGRPSIDPDKAKAFDMLKMLETMHSESLNSQDLLELGSLYIQNQKSQHDLDSGLYDLMTSGKAGNAAAQATYERFYAHESARIAAGISKYLFGNIPPSAIQFVNCELPVDWCLRVKILKDSHFVWQNGHGPAVFAGSIGFIPLLLTNPTSDPRVAPSSGLVGLDIGSHVGQLPVADLAPARPS